MFRKSFYRGSLVFLNLVSIKCRRIGVQSGDLVIHYLSRASHKFCQHEAHVFKNLARSRNIHDSLDKSILCLSSKYQYGLPGVDINSARLLDLSSDKVNLKLKANCTEELLRQTKKDYVPHSLSLPDERNATHILITDSLFRHDYPLSRALFELVEIGASRDRVSF